VCRPYVRILILGWNPAETVSPATWVSQGYHGLISAEEDESDESEDLDYVEEDNASNIDTYDEDDAEGNGCDLYSNTGDVPMADMMDDEERELSRLKALSGKSHVNSL
jgi:hypothetical protein